MDRKPGAVLGVVVSWLIVSASGAAAQDNGGEPVVIGTRLSIHSTILGEDRPIMVHTPSGYDGSSTNYPVLYVLDGAAHFHHTSGTVQFLAANNRMPGMIVVAIPNTTDRTHDLTPPAVSDTANQFPTAGGADNFLRFLREELQPWVEQRYRTAPYSVLIGHSFGGLFATHTLITQPTAFDAYISISPSLWWDGEGWVAAAESMFANQADLEGSLYMTMGSEGGAMLAGAWSLTRILESQAPESFAWEWKLMEAEDHGSVPHRSTYDGLEWLFRDWQMPDFVQTVMDGGDSGIAKVDAHYAKLSESFGFAVRAPQGRINQIGRFLLREKRTDDALRVLQANVRWHPESARAYVSVANAYEAVCRWESAREGYARAYHMTSDNGGAGDAGLQEDLDRVAEKIRDGAACPTS